MNLEEIKIPSVVKDHNSKTAIVIRTGRKYVHLIPMKSGKLTVKRLTAKQYENAEYTMMEIDLNTALNKYLNHLGGHTDVALKELNDLQ